MDDPTTSATLRRRSDGAVAAIRAVRASAFTIPTETPESDGTLAWNATTLVVAEVQAGNQTGLGYTYTDRAACCLIKGTLAEAIVGQDAMDVARCWWAMEAAVRNIGRQGLAAMAIAAVDVALWDLKAKVLGLPLVDLTGRVREAVPLYGSGGFTSYRIDRLKQQLAQWASEGFCRVKMKVGRDPEQDRERVKQARKAIGPDVALFVDANGAYSAKRALQMAQVFAAEGVSWFEEPVSSDDLAGLRFVRKRTPPGMDVAAGEYGYGPRDFEALLDARAVDVLQADATRCGITGFLQAGALCSGRGMPLSAHCAPALHAHLGCMVQATAHLEFFHDHARIEQLLFDGTPRARGGKISPDRSRPGLGLELRRQDAERFESLGP